MSSQTGFGTVTLPAGYVREHVRLGYAATEHGNQGDTTTIGIVLATAATTRRGLYVGATRGREQNVILVATDSADVDDARDVLDRVLASDGVDIPATTQRRTLATTNQPPAPPVRRREPRHPIPEWYDDLEAHVRQALDDARRSAEASRRSVADLEQRLAAAEQDLTDATAELEPHQPALAATRHRVDDTHRHLRRAEYAATEAPRRQRRAARQHLDSATSAHRQAVAERQRLEGIIAPASARYHQATTRVTNLRASLTPARFLHDWSPHARQADDLARLVDALHHWRAWANGEAVAPPGIRASLAALEQAGSNPRHQNVDALAVPLRQWADDVGIDAPRQ